MLEALGETARFIHVAFGAVGLVAFWVPVFARKGAKLHVSAGKVFVWCAYVVLGAAALALLFRTVGLVVDGATPADQPALYSFIVFLGYLTLVTFVTVRHGMALLQHKRDPAALRTPSHIAMAWIAIFASTGVIAYAALMDSPIRILLYAMSPIGFQDWEDNYIATLLINDCGANLTDETLSRAGVPPAAEDAQCEDEPDARHGPPGVRSVRRRLWSARRRGTPPEGPGDCTRSGCPRCTGAGPRPGSTRRPVSGPRRRGAATCCTCSSRALPIRCRRRGGPR